MYFTYVIKSLSNGRFYTGSTKNLERRLQEHNSGTTKSTRYTGPYILIYFEKFDTRTKAVHRELFFKSGKGRELLKEKLSAVA